MDRTNGSKKGSDRHLGYGGKTSPSGSALQVGRILRTYPRYGRLDIYVKRDKTFGAAFICEENGGRYGVTQGVRERLSDPGRYNGWGYINPGQTVVFKFLLGDSSNVPERLVAIETSDGRVDFPASIRSKAEYPDRSIVAFYACLVKRNPPSPPRRKATHVFLVDADHLPLAAILISAGRLTFPDHIEVLQLFFDSLPGIKGLDQQNLRLFDSALAYLAADASVPSQFQGLARVERCKLSAVDGTRAVAEAPQQAPRYVNLQEGDSVKPKVGRSGKGSIVTDVMRVDLQIGKD
jgi:hypothetical protein